MTEHNQKQTENEKIYGIVNFMKYCTTLIDPEEILSNQGIVDIENFTEAQVTYCLEKGGVQKLDIKTLFQDLNNLNTNDIRLINSNKEIFDFFMLMAGGLYYAKSIRRLIKKEDILQIKEMFSQTAYNEIMDFSKSSDALEGYPLFDDFKNRFISMGYRILNVHLNRLSPSVIQPLMNKLSLEEPVFNSNNLRISNEYAVKLAIQTRDFIINQSE